MKDKTKMKGSRAWYVVQVAVACLVALFAGLGYLFFKHYSRLDYVVAVARDTMTVSCLFLGLGLLCGKNARWYFTPLLLVLFVYNGIVTYLAFAFHMQLRGDWFLIITNTSFKETMLFLRGLLAFWPIVGLLIFAVAVGFVVRIAFTVDYPTLSRRRVIVAGLLLSVFTCVNCLCVNPRVGLGRVPLVGWVRDTVRTYQGYQGWIQACRRTDYPENLAIDARTTEQRPLGVFVLGESATRNNWGLYGYPRPTTPCLSALRNELYVFTDVLTAAPQTATALRLLLSNCTLEHPYDADFTFPNLCHAAGYPCHLISNQYFLGKGISDLIELFNGCDKRTYLALENLKDPYYDDACLPYVTAVISNSRGGGAVFVHLNGSHYPVEKFYPTEQSVFRTDSRDEVTKNLSDSVCKTMNHYDNSIHFTDSIIGTLITELSERKGPSFLVYISDHGESPRADGWRVITEKDVWEIPMVVWLSSDYRQQFPEVVKCLESSVNKPLQSDQLLTGFCTLMRLKGLPFTDDTDFLSPVFKTRPVRMLYDKVYKR